MIDKHQNNINNITGFYFKEINSTQIREYASVFRIFEHAQKPHKEAKVGTQQEQIWGQSRSEKYRWWREQPIHLKQ